MSKKRRIGLLLFSLVLWIQLVFTTGMMLWRFWSVSTGSSEIFLGIGPALGTAELIDSVERHCPNGQRIFYVGDHEANSFFIRYQLYPRVVSHLSSNWTAEPIEDEILAKIESQIGDNEQACIMVDGITLQTPSGDERFEVNSIQSVILHSSVK